jgi:hypothetical protein
MDEEPVVAATAVELSAASDDAAENAVVPAAVLLLVVPETAPAEHPAADSVRIPARSREKSLFFFMVMFLLQNMGHEPLVKEHKNTPPTGGAAKQHAAIRRACKILIPRSKSCTYRSPGLASS